MNRQRRIWLIISMFLIPIVAMAQGGQFLSRQQLDSLVNPSQSRHAAGMLVAENRHKNIGTIGDDELVNISFKLRNTTSEPITITELHSSCRCLKVITQPTIVEPQATLRVDARFNPKGRNSAFRYTINVYTNLDSRLPSEQLSVEGEVKSGDNWLHLPEHIGELRLSRKDVVIKKYGEERIACANSGSSPLRITAQSTIVGLSLRTEPEVLEPNSQGDIIISYKNRGELHEDIQTMLILDGVHGTPTDRVIRITIKR